MTESNTQDKESLAISNTYSNHKDYVTHTHDNHHVESNLPAYFRIDSGMVIWTWVCFLLLLIILGKYAWKPILKKLDERENFIKDSIEDAEKAIKALEETNEKSQKILAEAQLQAKEINQKARETANQLAENIEKRAKEEASKILIDARKTIEQEKNTALKLLKTETADLSLQIVQKLLRENIDSQKNRELIEKFIEEISD